MMHAVPHCPNGTAAIEEVHDLNKYTFHLSPRDLWRDYGTARINKRSHTITRPVRCCKVSVDPFTH